MFQLNVMHVHIGGTGIHCRQQAAYRDGSRKAELPVEPCSPVAARAGCGITGGIPAGWLHGWRRLPVFISALSAFTNVIPLISAYKGSSIVTVWAYPMRKLWVFMRIKG